MKRIRKGDQVVVITGKSRGQRGTVLKLVGDDKVLVENVNMIKRHTKPNPSRGTPGGIVEKEAPLHLSTVMLFTPATSKGDRVGFRSLDDGRKVRIFRSTGEVVDA